GPDVRPVRGDEPLRVRATGRAGAGGRGAAEWNFAVDVQRHALGGERQLRRLQGQRRIARQGNVGKLAVAAVQKSKPRVSGSIGSWTGVAAAASSARRSMAAPSSRG